MGKWEDGKMGKWEDEKMGKMGRWEYWRHVDCLRWAPIGLWSFEEFEILLFPDVGCLVQKEGSYFFIRYRLNQVFDGFGVIDVIEIT
ncbi:MAG: hypothetical protein WCK18_15335 [Prolixibacteraceae bacterium]